MSTPVHSTSNLRLQVDTGPGAALPNLFPDPSASQGTWALSVFTYSGDQTTLTSDGTKFTVTCPTTAGSQLRTNYLELAAGRWFRVRYTITTVTAGHSLRCGYSFYDADKNFIAVGAAIGSVPTVSSGVSYSPAAQAPAGTAYVQVLFTIYKGAVNGPIDAGATASFNLVMCTQAATSAALNVPFAFTDYITWGDILGPTHEITVDRAGLDLGTLTATVLDASLDPAIGGAIQTGRAVRLQALVAAVWEDIFTGNVDDADVTYTLDERDNSVRTSIMLTATDNDAVLTNTPQQYGVAVISQLPTILEFYAQVPWKVNGSRNHIPANLYQDPVAYNTDATAFDQVSITRDTDSGYAWVDRHNVLVANDDAHMPSTVAVTFTDTDNPFLNPGFETDTSSWSTAASFGTNAGATLTRITSDHDTGTASGSVTTTSASNQQGIWADITVPAGVTAIIKARVKPISGRPVLLRSRDVTNSVSGTTGTSGAAGSGWQTLQTSVTAGASSATVRVAVSTDTTAAVSTFLVDSLTCRGLAYLNSYRTIAAGWNTKELINQVNITWLRTTGTTTEEIAYGPYSDTASVSKYGAKAASFVLQGTTESSAAIKAFALAVIAANKTPVRKASALTMPVRDTRSMGHAALVDIYDLVGVQFSNLINAQYRVTSIKHSIDTERWDVEYGFAVDGAVATPLKTPSVPA